MVPVTYFLNVKQTKYKVDFETLRERLLKKNKEQDRQPRVQLIDCLPSLHQDPGLVPSVI